jgi:DNA-binding NarL/FixJ family response regulator
MSAESVYTRMASICCLAGINRSAAPIFEEILTAAGFATPIVARLDVRELGAIAPALLVCDVDGLQIDPLEFLRRLRFVLPECSIAVYTGVTDRAWAVACHLAGATGVFSKASHAGSIAAGIARVLSSGCFTDPHFSPEFHDTGAVKLAL